MQKENPLKKYLESLFLFCWLSIILSALALNRVSILIIKNHPLVEFTFRVYVEHFLTGFWMVLAGLFFLYSGRFIYTKLRSKRFSMASQRSEIIITLLTLGVYIIFEIYYQFFMNYNIDSFLQTIFLFLGIFCGFWFMRKENFL